MAALLKLTAVNKCLMSWLCLYEDTVNMTKPIQRMLDFSMFLITPIQNRDNL